MSLKDKIIEQTAELLKDKVLDNPKVMRLASDDRVMKLAEGLMDAPERAKAAWKILRDGYELPNVDPALDGAPASAPTKSKRSAASSPAASRASTSGSPAPAGSEDMEESMSERRSLATIGGKDVFEKAYKFTAADNARKRGI